METILETRLKHLAKMNKKSMASILRELDLNAGFVTGLGRNKSASTSDTLIKFADYFDVSIDYLLGRTDKPEVNR